MFRVLLMLAIFLGGLVLPLVMPMPVYAATSSLAVAGTGGLQAAITYHGGAADYTVLNDDNGDTSYALVGGGINTNSFDMTNFGAAYASITGVTLYVKIRNMDHNIGYLWHLCRIGGVSYFSPSSQDIVGDPFNYYTLSYTWPTNPAGGDWTDTAINNAEWGWKQNKGIAGTRTTYMYLVVTYTPVSVPTVSTSAATSISANTTHCWATLNGDVTDDGGANITARGFAWGTTSNITTPGNETPAASYTDNWTEWTANWGTGAFSYTANLSCCTIYYYRAYALNSQGWSWGSEESFTTLCDPDIDVAAASYVAATTARLNSLVIDDGGQAADVRFAYGLLTGNCTDGALGCPSASCNATSYNVTTTAWVLDTYTTGQTPYVDLAGLISGATYYFCVQIRNDVSCRCGGELSFTTPIITNRPTDFQGIPTATEISLAWVKSAGSTNTLVRYKLGDYPNSLVDGTEVYFDTMTSVVHEVLTPGTTYFYRAWGESGGTYTADNVTLIVTTLAIAPGGDTFPTPETPSQWFQAPDYTSMRYMPFYPIVNFAADQFDVPYATMWYMLALAMCVAGGVVFYSFIPNANLVLSVFVVGVLIMLMAFLKLLPMWHIIVYGVFAGVGIFVGERR